MNYEKALKQVGYAVPKTIKGVIEKGEKARDVLNSVRLGTRKIAKKNFHFYRAIIQEAESAKEEGYKMPKLENYMADVDSVHALKERYKTALDKFEELVENNFDIDPDNISKIEIDRLVDLVFKIESHLTH